MRITFSPKVILKIALIMAIVVVLSMLFFYTYPRNIISDSISVSSDETNDVVSISYSLTKKNSLFKPTQITGKIVFNNIEYVSMSLLGYDYYESNSFLKNIQLKHQGFRYDLFVRSDLIGNQMSLLKDTITIEKLDEEEIVICKSNESGGESILYTITLIP